MILYFNFNFWWQFWWQFRWQLVAIGGKMKNEILNCKILIKTCGDKMVTKWWQLVAIGGNWWQKCSFKAWFETDEYFNEMYSIIKKKIIFIKEKYWLVIMTSLVVHVDASESFRSNQRYVHWHQLASQLCQRSDWATLWLGHGKGWREGVGKGFFLSG